MNFSRQPAVQFDSDQIRAVAREKLQHRSFLELFIIQGLTEWRLRLLRGVNFRFSRNDKALAAYTAMGVSEFEGINARQVWSNWRTIPRNLSGLFGSAPVRALDLCSGTGQSTQVLAYYLPAGSEILGLEVNPTFVKRASEKAYMGREGQPGAVHFQCQSVLEPFREFSGKLVPPGSVDLVNSCGSIGIHFDQQAVELVAQEISRALRHGGYATIDVGLPGSKRTGILRAFARAGLTSVRAVRSCALDPYRQICFRKES